MESSQFVKWSGAAAILAGILGIANVVFGGVTVIYYGGLVVTLVAVVGIYLFLRDSAGTLALIGLVVAAIGLVLSIIGIAGISEAAYGLGMILLGIAALRAGSFSAWVPWLWIGAVVIGISGGFLGSLQDVLYPLSSVLFGLGLIGAGAILSSSN
ncbi:MAG: hypothetical protein WBR18_07970 [Anaerolineales bacterium]